MGRIDRLFDGSNAHLLDPEQHTADQSELIRRCTEVVDEADALLQLLLAGQEQLAKLEQRVLRIEMRLASCR